MADMDLRLVIETMFPNKAVLDQVMAAIRGFQEGQVTKNQTLISQNSQIIQQMARMGTISQTQLSALNQTLAQYRGTNPFAATTKGANDAATAVTGIGNAGKFSVRVLEAFVLYRGFVFLQQGAMNTTRALIELNHQLLLVQNQLPGMGQGQYGFLQAGVMGVARETGLGFNEVSKALYNISSAGYSGAEAMRVLELSAKAAVAGGLKDVDVAFNAALSSMNSFGIEADRLEEVLDKQFTAVRRGIFTYEQFGQQVGVLSEAFAQAGQSIETTYAAMATVSQVFTGPQFARGATGLRNLAEALTQHRDDFESYGIAIVDVNGDIRSLIDVVGDLKAITDTMTTAERASLISNILPDVREQAGVVALIENFDDLKRNYVEQRLALGDLERAYDTVNDSIQTQLGVLKTNVQQGFTPLADTLGTVVGGMNRIESIIPGVTSGIVGMTASVTALALAYGYLNKEIALSGGGTISRGAAFMATARSPMVGGSRLTTPLFIGSQILTMSGASAAGQQGFNWGGFAASTGGGAALGLTGGPWGAAAGGLIGAAAYTLSAAFSEKNMETAGKSLAEAFGEALRDEKSVSEALKIAMGEAAGGGARGSLAGLQAGMNRGFGGLGGTLVQSSRFYTQESAERLLSDIERYGSINIDFPGGGSRTLKSQEEAKQFLYTGVLANMLGPYSYRLPNVSVAPVLRSTTQSAIAGINDLRTPENQQLIRAISMNTGRGEGDVFRELSDTIIQEAVAGMDIQETYRGAAGTIVGLIANAVVQEKIGAADVNTALSLFAAGDMEGFLDFIDQTAAAAPLMENFVDKLTALTETSLEDQIRYAADHLGELANTFGYTQESLYAFADDLQDYNRTIFKIGVVQEIQRLGEIAGYNADALNPVLQSLVEDIKLGGSSFAEIFADPKRLAELLAEVEFGDISVDQSQDFNIVLRISSGADVDLSRAAEFGDAIVRELGDRVQRRR